MVVRDTAPGSLPADAQPAQTDADPRRWLILAVIAAAQLMIVLDLTVMNLGLPSAQHALKFSSADRQWVVTAYALSFGSLLLFCGRLGDLIGRKVTFLTGLAGFAVASAVGGAAVDFPMLVTARACQGSLVRYWHRPLWHFWPRLSMSRRRERKPSAFTARSRLPAAGWDCCWGVC